MGFCLKSWIVYSLCLLTVEELNCILTLFADCWRAELCTHFVFWLLKSWFMYSLCLLTVEELICVLTLFSDCWRADFSTHFVCWLLKSWSEHSFCLLTAMPCGVHRLPPHPSAALHIPGWWGWPAPCGWWKCESSALTFLWKACAIQVLAMCSQIPLGTLLHVSCGRAVGQYISFPFPITVKSAACA